MTAFDPDQMRRALWRLDLSLFAPIRSPLDKYCRHYGLDLESELPVRHYCGYFDAAGFRIAAHAYLPEQAARGTVFIVHGYLDHAGLYRKLIVDCLQKGYAVFIHDLPGHGLSSGERVNIANFQAYQDVLGEALAKYRNQLPQPFYAIGQSTGGAILMDHVLTAKVKGRQPAFKKVLLLAPLVRPAQWRQIRFGYWLIRHLRPSVPRVFRANSSDEAFLRFVREDDPLQDRVVPMGWIGALKRWVAYMHTLPAADYPVLLVQGRRDETVDWRYNLAFVQRHFKVEKFMDVAEASHQLANERDDLRAPVHDAMRLMLAAAGA